MDLRFLQLINLVCKILFVFQQIETRTDNVPISDHARLYRFRAISHCIYSFHAYSKKILLQSDGFFRDEYKYKNEDVDESSSSFTIQAELINKNIVFHPNFIPRIDTWNLSKYFPPGNTLTLKCIQSPHHFALLAIFTSWENWK